MALFCTCDFFHNVKFMANKHKSFFLLTVKRCLVCTVEQILKGEEVSARHVVLPYYGMFHHFGRFGVNTAAKVP